MPYILLARGTKESHSNLSINKIPTGEFSVVLDAPELRYHDGINQGGVAIPLPEAVHSHLLAHYTSKLSKQGVPKCTQNSQTQGSTKWWRKLLPKMK